MLVGIGCDLVEHEMTQKLKWSSEKDIQKRIFSIEELELYQTNPTVEFLSARFAVKEAVLKCLGIGMDDGIALPEIETLNDQNGKPRLKLSGTVKKLSDEKNIGVWHISITHTTRQSLAFVVAEALET